jgi:tRNA1(Val) A37 N6-methylase TrmN6
MTFSEDETTTDGFLGGRLQISQPVHGYRAATDPVFLAASVQAKPQDRILELGCGVGVASLCLAARLQDVQITGLELQHDYAELARQNAARNDIAFDVVEGDLGRMPAALKDVNFDHVIINPPFFDKGSVSKPRNAGKATAHVIETELAAWIDAGLKRLKPNGTLTIIQLAEQLSDILVGLNGRAGGIQIFPLASRKGRAAKRVIVRAQKAARAPMKLLAPFHVHDGVEHVQGKADYTNAAAAVLRDGAALNWENSS